MGADTSLVCFEGVCFGWPLQATANGGDVIILGSPGSWSRACCSTYLSNPCCRVSNGTRLIRCPQRPITCSIESENTWGWFRSSNMFGQERIATSLHAAIQS